MKVHVATEPAEAHRSVLERAAPSADVSYGGAAAEDTEVLVSGRPGAAELAGLPGLRAVVVPFAGVPPETLTAARAVPGLAVYNLHHNAAATAEKALELLFAVSRRTLHYDPALRAGDWGGRGEVAVGITLAGRSALVLGYGEVGRRVAAVLVALGMRVRATQRVVRRASDGEVELHSPHALSKLLPKSEVVVVCLPLTQETEGLLGAEELSLMPEGAVLVNVGRAKVVDEEALFAALESGRLYGAGLDVWWKYPPRGGRTGPPSAFDFASLPNVVMSPHCGGSTADTESARWEALGHLLARLSEGKPPPPVDLDAGY
jgi:phosphoglycerate dehydrogenase-like enzyme